MLRACDYDRIIKKFEMETRNSGDRLAWLKINGKIVVRTRRSHHKGGDIPASHLIRQQLKLNEKEMQAAISCDLTKDGYIAILKQKGIL